MIKALLLGSSLVAQITGLLLFKESFATTPTTTTANPYQSALYQVEITIPEPAQSILRFSGLGLALIGSPALFFCGISASNKKKTTQDMRSPSTLQSTPEPFRSGVDNRTNRDREVLIEEPLGVTAPIRAPKKYIAQEIQQPKQFDFDFNQLEDADPYEPVRSLVHENTVGICGKQKGSGKTSKLGYLLGEHIKLGHLCFVGTPFARPNQFKGVRVFGRGHNFEDLARGIDRFTKEAKRRMTKACNENYDPFSETTLVLLLDEVSNYATKVEAIAPNVMTEFWEVVTQYLRQVNMSVVIASHGMTQTMLGGSSALKGKSDTIFNGMTWLYAQATLDPSIPGGQRCAGWAYLQRPDGELNEKVRIEIPQWMQPPNKEYDYTELISQHCSKLLYLEKGQRQETKIEINPQPNICEQANDYRKEVEEQSELLKSLRDRINNSELE